MSNWPSTQEDSHHEKQERETTEQNQTFVHQILELSNKEYKTTMLMCLKK